jgi:hypothetical protein
VRLSVQRRAILAGFIGKNEELSSAQPFGLRPNLKWSKLGSTLEVGRGPQNCRAMMPVTMRVVS